MNINTFKVLLFSLAVLFLTGCAQKVELHNGDPQWDFDHKLQYRETQLSTRQFHIEVVRLGKVRFSQMATFLVRRAKVLCSSYGFKLEILSGVEGFDDKRSFPNMIMPSLIANVECPNNVKPSKAVRDKK